MQKIDANKRLVLLMTELMIRVNLSREMTWLEDSNLQKWDVLISSHILESFQKRITSMIVKLNRPYVIDPRTYVFGNDVSDIREKRWFVKLLGHYGLDTMVDDPNIFKLSSSTFIDDGQPTNNLKELVNNVMNYQRTKIQDTYDEINEFEEFDNEHKIQDFKPKWIIPPYFFMDVSRKDWRIVNTQSIKLAVENKNPNEKIFAVIMIDKEMLPYNDDIEKILSDYDIKGIDGYMIWCAALNENAAKKSELEYFQHFIKKLSEYEKPIHSMYGGLFSSLLGNIGMTGISHSICYGEYKDPFPVGSGGMITRFYQPNLYSKVPLARMEEIESALKLEKCYCEYCNILRDKSIESSKVELTGKHFLLTRIKELEEINSKGTSKFLAKLMAANKNAAQHDVTRAYVNNYDRFSVWDEAIKKYTADQK